MLVVTGASGFLGRRVISRAAENGLAVVAISRQAFEPPPGAEMIQVTAYSALLPPASGATLVHLAEESDIAVADAKGESYVECARSAFAAIASKGWRHIVYASSSVVYGDKESHSRTEDEDVAAERPYIVAKLAGETIATAGGGCALRLGNLYGNGMASRTVLSDIMRQLPGSDPIYLRDLAPVRDFISVDDVADGVLLAAERKLSGIFNLGTGIGTSVADLARNILDLSGQHDRPIVETSPASRRSHIVLDMKRTITATGWRPATTLEDGLSRLLGEMQ